MSERLILNYATTTTVFFLVACFSAIFALKFPRGPHWLADSAAWMLDSVLGSCVCKAPKTTFINHLQRRRRAVLESCCFSTHRYHWQAAIDSPRKTPFSLHRKHINQFRPTGGPDLHAYTYIYPLCRVDRGKVGKQGQNETVTRPASGKKRKMPQKILVTFHNVQRAWKFVLSSAWKICEKVAVKPKK